MRLLQCSSGLIRSSLLVAFSFFVLAALCDTDSGDLAVLQDLLLTVSNPSKLPDWKGSDPCGRWNYVLCSGTRVTQLQLKNVGLEGSLPLSLNKLSSLQQIALQGNSLSGPLPSFNGLSQLSVAYLGDQQFTSIPTDFFKGLTSLKILTLQNNPLNSTTGWSLPLDIVSASSLSILILTNTSLSGPIPYFLGNLTSLQELRLAYNGLTGSIPSSFANLAQLSRFELNNQGLPGILSGSIDVVGKMPSLTVLWLQVNKFSGAIPEELGNAVSLQDCRLNDNQFVGIIPPSFASLNSLRFFSVRNNLLVGSIPDIAYLNSSTYIFSGSNGFCASMVGVQCDSQVTALLSFLEGVAYPTFLVSSWMGNNPCSGWQGATCDTDKKDVIAINLPGTSTVKLSGTISPDIANLTSLAKLVLSGNNLTGTIPDALTKLTSLVEIDVSNNNIQGPVPNFTSRVTLLDSGNPNINMSMPLVPSSSSTSSPSTPRSNDLPPGVTMSNAGTSKGPPPGVTMSNPGTSKGPLSVGAIAGLMVGGITIILFAVFLGVTMCRKRRDNFHKVQIANIAYLHPADGADTVKVTVQSNITNACTKGSIMPSVTQSNAGRENVQVLAVENLVISINLLRKVTDDFSEINVLGRGGFGVVYKGELDDGTKIAVKRMLSSMVSRKGLDEFQAEIAVLTKVRHRHLVALLGYCIEDNERLLVYEYIPQGPLSEHLFEWNKLGLAPLSWKNRLSIALDVARGVEYLHGLAHKSFIHRDLKSSNILLGDDYRAKVADFGLVRLAPEGQFSVETRLAGTFGYLAPEYAVTGRVTTKVDVFSFGVVLMELLTGHKALDETRSELDVHLVSWFRRVIGNKGAILAVVDPTLEVTEEIVESIVTVVELAGHCTNRDPQNRPDMCHAVIVLSSLVELWKPSSNVEDDENAIDLDMSLPQALNRWQAYSSADGCSTIMDSDATIVSLPACPSGLVQSFTSADGR